jgi:hypothetical protein
MTEDDAELLADVHQALRREEYYDTAVIEFLLRLLDEERAARRWLQEQNRLSVIRLKQSMPESPR